MTRVIVYPAFDALYYSFYLQGLFETFGASAVRFSYRGFPEFSSEYLAFVVRDGGELRMVVDAYDGATLKDTAPLQWCDVYGKINLLRSRVPEAEAHKCVAIGPSFPVRVWPWPEAAWRALAHYRRGAPLKSAREHFANYFRQRRYRLPLEAFIPGEVRENYVFFSSTIWPEEEAPGTNRSRAAFMEACKSFGGLVFEGGFSPPRSPEERAGYEAHIAPRRFPFREWLEKTKASMVVFNAPAMWQSHAWKLPEFMAVAKAIVSMPLSRELPAPLVHGEHVHYVDGSPEALREAIALIVKNRDYRRRLERGARGYYLNHLAPQRVIERLLRHGRAVERVAAAASFASARDRRLAP